MSAASSARLVSRRTGNGFWTSYSGLRSACFPFATTMKKLEHNRNIRPGAVRAFVLCGGAGTRLRPMLADRPKSMALISGTPFLELLLDSLRSHRIGEVILGTGYMAEKIESYFGSGNKLEMRIRYSREHEPLGTGGALKLQASRTTHQRPSCCS